MKTDGKEGAGMGRRSRQKLLALQNRLRGKWMRVGGVVGEGGGVIRTKQ